MKEYIEATIAYIDNHLDEEINLDLIAAHIGFSKFYLNHMFSIYTGLSIMVYVRKQKLAYAVDCLSRNMRVLDVAVAIGYRSERALHRALVKAYGYPPTYFRTHAIASSRPLRAYDLSMTHEIIGKVKAEGVENMKAYLSDVQYITLDEMIVLSGTKEGSEPEEEIIALMEDLQTHYQLNVKRVFGFDSPVDSDEPMESYRGYESWLVIDGDDLDRLPDRTCFEYCNTPIRVKHIPSYRYAKLRIFEAFRMPFERIPMGWKALVAWLEEHEFKSPDFERNINANCLEELIHDGDKIHMDIFIPVDRC